MLGRRDSQKPVPSPQTFSQESTDVPGQESIILPVELDQMLFWVNLVEQLCA
jgi:hypothetical protein